MRVLQLSIFYQKISDDNRITTTHISLYMALFELWNRNHFKNPVSVTRSGVMQVAKISGIATFHKCMKDLVSFGYIEYMPSYDPAVSSRVNLLN